MRGPLRNGTIRSRVSLWAGLAAAASVSALLHAAAPAGAPLADAAMREDQAAVTTLLQKGGDVNAAQGDGMTALHWAAFHGDAALTASLLKAGANVKATTRLGSYSPLHLAAKIGAAPVIEALVNAGADVSLTTSTGATPLMLAAAAGDEKGVGILLDHGADPNVAELANGETALMFAAAFDRPEAAALLMHRGARANVVSTVVDRTDQVPPEERLQDKLREDLTKKAASASTEKKGEQSPDTELPPRKEGVPGVTRGYRYEELVGRQGGLTALHFAARQGAASTVKAMVEAGADVNALSAADGTSALVIATINGQFDIAKYLLDHGANPTLATEAGMTPLYAAVNIEWAPKSFYPQPRAQLQQHTTYLELMKALLEKGADPNVRLKHKIWYNQYNFDLLRVDEGGATPFWRAAYSSDIEAMALLVEHGADPSIPTMKPAGGRVRGAQADRDATPKDVSAQPPVPAGGPDIPPLLAAAGAGYGEGFAANAHRFAPTGMLAGVKFLVEQLHVDVNARDADGNTALHNAASRGDNEMIEYLVSKGADVTAVNRRGQTTVDMANGPVQRTQPYPETIKLLEGLGAKNNHKCVSC